MVIFRSYVELPEGSLDGVVPQMDIHGEELLDIKGDKYCYV